MKTIVIYNNSDNKAQGIFKESNGTYLALTFSQSKNFKTLAAAKRWIEKRL